MHRQCAQDSLSSQDPSKDTENPDMVNNQQHRAEARMCVCVVG